MNKHQQRVIDEAPASCKGIMERAYSGDSRATAIKAFCLRCIGYIRADITNCTAWACPLHPYRPYQTGPDEPDLPAQDVEEPAENAAVEGQKRAGKDE